MIMRADGGPPDVPPVCVIPVLDAEASVGGVVAAVRAAVPGAYVIAVDDGSRDGSRRVLAACVDHLIAFERNRGKGAALRDAFAHVAAELPDRPVVTIDADGQHDASMIPAMLAALNAVDIVIGTRAIGAAHVPSHRRLANRLSTAAASMVIRYPIRDSQSGFRAMRAGVVAAVHARGDRYEFETDFLVRAALRGYTIGEVEVPTIYGPPSHFRELRDAWLVARVLWSHRARAFARSANHPSAVTDT